MKSRSAKTMTRRWIPVVIWAIVLFVLSSIPSDKLPLSSELPGLDKIIHFLIYMVFGALAMNAAHGTRLSPWIIWLLCVGYGVTDEVHQYFIPGRMPSVYDLLADIAGSGLGVFIVVKRYNKRRKNAEAAVDVEEISQSR